MPTTVSARFALRDATSDWHARVDAAFSPGSMADPAHYGRLLQAQAAAHLPIERSLEEGGIGVVIADWPERQRAELIRRDLEALGLTIPVLEKVPPLRDVPSLLGAAYVLEGSRLGGLLLARSVPSTLPSSFLSAHRPAAWRELATLLDQRLGTASDIAVAVAAASAAFALFERSAYRLLVRAPSSLASAVPGVRPPDDEPSD